MIFLLMWWDQLFTRIGTCIELRTNHGWGDLLSGSHTAAAPTALDHLLQTKNSNNFYVKGIKILYLVDCPHEATVRIPFLINTNLFLLVILISYIIFTKYIQNSMYSFKISHPFWNVVVIYNWGLNTVNLIHLPSEDGMWKTGRPKNKIKKCDL